MGTNKQEPNTLTTESEIALDLRVQGLRPQLLMLF